MTVIHDHGPSRFLEGLLLPISLVSMSVLLVLGLWLARSAAIDVSGMDMNVVFSIQQMLLGRDLYPPTELAPYAVTQYAPLYYLIVFSLAKLLGVTAFQPIALTEIARGFSVSVAIALAGVCYAFLRRRIGVSGRTGFIATAFVMAATVQWYYGVRVDGLATLLTILSFYIIAAESPDGRISDGRLFAALLCCIAAALAKQNGVIAGFVVVGFLVATRSWRQVIISTVTLVLAAGATLIIANVLGQQLIANIVDGINNGITIRATLMEAYRPFFYWSAPVAAAGIAGVILLWRRGTSRLGLLLAIATTVSLLLSLATAVKRGAAENYFNEFVILATFTTVYAFGRGRSGQRQSAALEPSVKLAILIYLLAFFPIRTGRQIYVSYLHHRVAEDTRLYAQRGPAKYVRDHLEPGRTAIGFAVGLSNMIPDRMLVPQKDISVSSDYRGVIDYSRYRDDVAAGRVQFAIMKGDEKIDEFMGASFRNYKLVRRFPHYLVYEFDSAAVR